MHLINVRKVRISGLQVQASYLASWSFFTRMWGGVQEAMPT
jgi:hypothetical protein